MDIQIYSERVIIESEPETSLVTLSNVDLSEIVAQVKISDLLELMDEADVTAYYDGLRKDA